MKTKTKKFKASIIIVNYNNAKFIDQCVSSIVGQDYQNIEIIFVDDASNDNSLEVVRRHKNIRIIKNKTKVGIGSVDQMEAYYLGYKKAKGEIIFLLDSDDYFKKKKISIIMKKFHDNDQLKIVSDLPIKKYSKKKIYIKNKGNFFNNHWTYFPPTSCIAMKRSIFQKVLKSTSIGSYPDIWLDFRIGIFSKYIFKQYFIINNNLTYYRQTSTNISSNFSHLSKNWWKRRMQAHSFVKYFFLRNKIIYKHNLDYYFTKTLNYFIK